MTFVTRFAPSPTGPLHLGHAYSAILAHDMARANKGRFLLRIEDIDATRARPEWTTQIFEDLTWLGLEWDQPVLHQSDRLSAYRTALERLWRQGALYPCACNRRDIIAAASAPQEGAPMFGPDGLIYPGTCRPNKAIPRTDPMPDGAALRPNMRAVAQDVQFQETGAGPDKKTGTIAVDAGHLVDNIGDVVLSRRDFLGSYHLSVVLDDAEQGISHVVRGADLFDATPIHVLLQSLLNLPTPVYHHHDLIRDDAGKRLAKRDEARAIARYRTDGATPQDIRRMVGLAPH